jgi:hypothetical protein
MSGSNSSFDNDLFGDGPETPLALPGAKADECIDQFDQLNVLGDSSAAFADFGDFDFSNAVENMSVVNLVDETSMQFQDGGGTSSRFRSGNILQSAMSPSEGEFQEFLRECDAAAAATTTLASTQETALTLPQQTLHPLPPDLAAMLAPIEQGVLQRPVPSQMDNSWVLNHALPSGDSGRELPPQGAKIPHIRGQETLYNANTHKWYPCTIPPRKDFGNIQYHKKDGKFTGELARTTRFNRETLEEYINGCYRQGKKLKFWVQHCPTYHNDRYIAEGVSHKCLWHKCPAKKRTMERGYLQVSLDENSSRTGYDYSPFHVAGFMHLCCLEEGCNLKRLMVRYPNLIAPDVRCFPREGKNPMSLERDAKAGQGLLEDYWKWVNRRVGEYQQALALGIPPPPQRFNHDHSLYRALNMAQGYKQPDTRDRSRLKRAEGGGVDHISCEGSLRRYYEKKEIQKQNKRKARYAAAAQQTSQQVAGSGQGLETPVLERTPAPADKQLSPVEIAVFKLTDTPVQDEIQAQYANRQPGQEESLTSEQRLTRSTSRQMSLFEEVQRLRRRIEELTRRDCYHKRFLSEGHVPIDPVTDPWKDNSR